MILLTLSRGKGEETVRLQLPASPAEIGETFAFLDRISLDTTATAILDVSSNVPVLYRCLYDVDVEDSEQFQKLQKLAERTEALSPAKAAIFSGALDAECVWNLEGALTVADRLDEYMLVNNVSSDSELGIYLVNKGITPFPDRFKPYINYARVGAEYREKHGGEYSSGNYVQKKTPELLENERLDGVFRIWMENPCPVRVQSETAQITLPATFEQLESSQTTSGSGQPQYGETHSGGGPAALSGGISSSPGDGSETGAIGRVGGKYPDNGSGGWRIAEIPLCP